MAEFRPEAPSAPAVFYRSYSRRKADDSRESYVEAIQRTITDIARIGRFNDEQYNLCLEGALNQNVFPSGRSLWVAGTEWSKKPDNFPGFYNCCSMHVDEVEIFGLLMELAMMGTGTGAVLEDDVIAKLPSVLMELSLKDVIPVGDRGGAADTSLLGNPFDNLPLTIRVGDSRQGWADAYMQLIKLSMGMCTYSSDGKREIVLDLSQVRPAGKLLKGFGGKANPVRLEETFRRVIHILADVANREVKKLTPIDACLIIDEAASAVVAGNIRRSAGIRQGSSDNHAFAVAKDGLYHQDEDGNWSVDPNKEALRMANHTRCFHHKPTRQEIHEAVTKQFYSGEGAIMYVPESVARANADLLDTPQKKSEFLKCYSTNGRKAAEEYLTAISRFAGYPDNKDIMTHRMDRYGLNPCFAPGTIVMTRDGYYPIESLVGKTVEVHDGNEWREIDNFRVTATDQDVYDLELHDGMIITATEYHKFILSDGSRKELKDLVPGDELMAAKVEPVKGSIEAKGAYLKGFLIGDGTSDKGKGAICKVYAPKKVCVDRLRASREELGVVRKRHHNGIDELLGRDDTEDATLTPSGYLRGLKTTSEDLNPWCYRFKHEFPCEVLNWTDEAKAEFLAGLFDADGTARDGGRSLGISYQITSVSRPFLEGLVIFLRTLGINSRIGPARIKGVQDFGPERGGICKVKPTYRLSINGKGSIKLAQLCSFERLKSFADRAMLLDVKSKCNCVKSITFSHNAPEVFCCTVDYTNSFTITGILIANCGEIIMRDNLCNLSEIHLNTLDPKDDEKQYDAFYAGGLQVAALLQHQFVPKRLQYSREVDPIVGVSFTGLFDFFVHAFGADWLQWMMQGRPEDSRAGKYFPKAEREFLARWREAAEWGVIDYCNQHKLRRPNRFTTVQPAGSKSLLTGASAGWHPPKSQRFIRRITFGVDDPLVSALRDWGYNVIPAQSARDELGNLLDDISDPRVHEVLVEIPTEVSWANLPGCDQFDLSKLPIEGQWGLYMQVQKYYTTHNTSATLEFREEEIDTLSDLISDAISKDDGYISAALLARFDANETFPRLPFEPISKEKYELLMIGVNTLREVVCKDKTFLDVLREYDDHNYELKGAAGCDSDKCLMEDKPRT